MIMTMMPTIMLKMMMTTVMLTMMMTLKIMLRTIITMMMMMMKMTSLTMMMIMTTIIVTTMTMIMNMMRKMIVITMMMIMMTFLRNLSFDEKLRSPVIGYGVIKIGEYQNSNLCFSSTPNCSSIFSLLSLKYLRGKRIGHPFPACRNSLSPATVL